MSRVDLADQTVVEYIKPLEFGVGWERVAGSQHYWSEAKGYKVGIPVFLFSPLSCLMPFLVC